LDEIQKIPRWSEVVKGLWDADRAEGLDLHVILLGSSPLLMQRGMTESLAGRFELLRLTHWSYLETYEAFGYSIEDYVYFGGYPGSERLIRREESEWRNYVIDSLIRPSIEQDILMMTRIDKPALLKQAFELGCAYSGQILSFNKMLGHLQDAGNTVTLANYLELLGQAGMLVGLQKYSGKAHRRRGSSPKLNVLDPCLMSVYSQHTKAEALADRSFWGRQVESVVGAHLYNTGAPDIGVYYWRESPHEVDFVIEKGRKLTAIEVKSGAVSRSVSGLAEFQRHHRHSTSLVVGTGGIPLAEFLSHSAEYWLGQGD
jgi:predicted AAA+ superfamily ATPase